MNSKNDPRLYAAISASGREYLRAEELKKINAELLAALEVVARCLPDSQGGVTLGSYEQGIVRDVIKRARGHA